MTESLQKSLVNHPKLLKSEEWKKHLEGCDTCYQEASILDKTLYLHLEEISIKYIPEIQIWENIQNKINKAPFSTWKLVSSLAAAAALVITISLFTLQQTNLQQIPTNLITTLPSGFKVVELQMGQPFGPPSSQTQFTWTENHFGISIDNKIKESNYSKISIGSEQQNKFATIFPKKKNFMELAYFTQPRMSSTVNIQQ